MNKKITKAAAIAIAGLISVSTAASVTSEVQNVGASSSDLVNSIHGKIEHLRWSLKNNYLGLKNVGTWQAYEKDIRNLIEKLPEGSSKTKYTQRVNECSSLINAAAKINHVEKSLEVNFHGIKNADTWAIYIEQAAILISNVSNQFEAQVDDLIYRLFDAAFIVDGIYEEHYTALYDIEERLYVAIDENNLDAMKALLVEAKKLGTHESTSELIALIEESIESFDPNAGGNTEETPGEKPGDNTNTPGGSENTPGDVAPVLSYNGEITINLEYGSQFTLPDVTTVEGTDESIEVFYDILDADGNSIDSIDTAVPGTYTIVYTAEDIDGNILDELEITFVVGENKATKAQNSNIEVSVSENNAASEKAGEETLNVDSLNKEAVDNLNK